ncbi:MAG: hypothetical protein WDO69_10140 [Pseudomonadota bacterium]
MRGWFQRGRFLLLSSALCAGMVGCAAQHDDSLRLSEELGRARANEAWQQARAAELESRLSRLEQRAAVSLSAQRAEDRELSSRLERLIQLNERLLAERAVAPVPGAAASAPVAASAARTAVTSAAPMASDEQQLRALAERMSGRPGSPRGGLTREQESALRVLTRPARKLDTENPWPAAFY